MNETIQLNDKALKELIKTFKSPLPQGRIGILGTKTGRVENKTTLTFKEVQDLSTNIRKVTTKTNAEIGAYHEFGGAKMPQRSFLRIPLTDNLNKYLKKSGAFKEATLKEVMRERNLFPWMQKVMVTCEAIVTDAFATRGFGKWPGWSNGYTNRTGQVLVDTQQLRNSISSEVK